MGPLHLHGELAHLFHCGQCMMPHCLDLITVFMIMCFEEGHQQSQLVLTNNQILTNLHADESVLSKG